MMRSMRVNMPIKANADKQGNTGQRQKEEIELECERLREEVIRV